MTSANRLIAAFALALGVATATRPAWSSGSAEWSAARTVTPGGSARAASMEDREYIGSAACQRCHETEYSAWRRSLHVQMTKPIGEAVVAGDFSGARLEDYGRTYMMDSREGRYFVSIARGTAPAENFEVGYTLGAKRFQGYLSRLPDGRMYVLPVFWHVETRRWIDWREITPVPDDDHDYRQIWNVNCFNCHATNIARNYGVPTNTFATTWTEMGIGCEACHGPGKGHADLMSAWEADPAERPLYDNSSRNRGLGRTLKIFSPRSADPRQVFDACGYCHGNKNNVFTGFAAGDRFEDYAVPFLLSEPIPDNDPQGEFWPDGRASRFNRPQTLTLAGCFRKGQITCTSCHVGHGSANEHSLKVAIRGADGRTRSQSDALCTQCHKTVVEHSHHPPESAGSRCIECHMSDVNWRLLTRRRDHTFASPTPEMTARYGVPNACTTCHDDRTPEWAVSVMDRWYGDRDRRRSVMKNADVMYMAGAGDPAALPDLARIAVDRRLGALLRASAAEFIGRLVAVSAATSGPRPSGAGTQTSFVRPGPNPSTAGSASAGREAAAPSVGAISAYSAYSAADVVNALIGAAADREPTVRITAVRALGQIGDRRALMPLVARLADDARVVRASAAEALLHMGVTALDGRAGVVLAKAQDEYAESLRTFPDVAADHASLAWLQAARGRLDDASREFSVAITLDPRDPRPRVLRGIVAARAGRYEDALRDWHAARKLQPGYPNIDRLIEEARKRIDRK